MTLAPREDWYKCYEKEYPAKESETMTIRANMPKSLDEASPEVLREMASQLRKFGIMALLYWMDSDPDAILQKDGRTKTPHNIPKFACDLAAEAFERVADDFDRNSDPDYSDGPS
jgi:hypothetical protein